MKAPGTKRLKSNYDNLLSSFAFKSNLRHYTVVLRLSGRSFPDRFEIVTPHRLAAGAYTRSRYNST